MKIGGKNINNWWLIAGAGGIAGIWYLYHRSSSSSGSPSAAGSVTDPATGQSYPAGSTDPATGMTYAQEISEYGSVAAAEAAGSGGGYGSYYGSAGGGYGGTAGYPTSSAGSTGGTGSFATNAAWSQAVTSGLTQLGYSATDVATALGMFFAGQPLGTLADGVSAASIVQAAEAEFGPPPQGTYSIIPEPSGGTPGAGSGGSVPPPPPPGGGTPPPAAGGPITVAPSGFRVASVNGLAVTLEWDPVQVPAGEGPLRGYVVAYGQSPGSTPYQQSVVRTATSTTIRFSEGPGAHGLTHYFILWADPANPGGPHAGPISAKTQ